MVTEEIFVADLFRKGTVRVWIQLVVGLMGDHSAGVQHIEERDMYTARNEDGNNI